MYIGFLYMKVRGQSNSETDPLWMNVSWSISPSHLSPFRHISRLYLFYSIVFYSQLQAFPSPALPRPPESARCVFQRGMTSSFCGRLSPRTPLPPKSQVSPAVRAALPAWQIILAALLWHLMSKTSLVLCSVKQWGGSLHSCSPPQQARRPIKGKTWSPVNTDMTTQLFPVYCIFTCVWTHLHQDGSGPAWGRSSLQPSKTKTLRWTPGGAGRGPCCCWTTTRNKTFPVCAGWSSHSEPHFRRNYKLSCFLRTLWPWSRCVVTSSATKKKCN